MEDNKSVAGYKKRKRQRMLAANAFVKYLSTIATEDAKCNASGDDANYNEDDDKPSRKLLTLADQIRMCPSFQNVKTVERLLASGPLNDFALWDLEGEACGCGFFPG